MKDVNKIILIGRLGADPVLRETKSGTSVASFPLATTRKFRSDSDTEAEALGEDTQWHRVVVWGKNGEACAKFLTKGQPVYVEGMVRSHRYDGKDGVSRLAFEVHADSVSFLGGMPGRSEEPVAAVEAYGAATPLSGQGNELA